jgi:predicted ATPase
MIQSFTISNFKSYQQAELKVAPLTVIIGHNASGKSNLLELIRLLNWMAQGHKISSLQYNTASEDQIVRGQLKDLFKVEGEPFSAGCSIGGGINATMQMSIDFRMQQELHIHAEECNIDTGFLYRTVRPTNNLATDILVEYNNYAKGPNKHQIVCSDQLAIFTQLTEASKYGDQYNKSKQIIPIAAKAIENALAKILFLDPVPARMRSYSSLTEKQLTGDGRNLSAVIYHLWQAGEHNQTMLLDFIKSLPEQDIAGIDFIKTPRNEVMITLKETFGNKERNVDAGVLSDGTLRILAFAAALLSAQKGSTVIVEEIDNGVHPSRAAKLMDSIRQIAQSRGLIVILTTHNPALLDALPYEVIPDVVYCYRDKETGASQLMRLGDLRDYPELTSRGDLGDLLAMGTIEQFVKYRKDNQQKKKEALAWLESIK